MARRTFNVSWYGARTSRGKVPVTRLTVDMGERTVEQLVAALELLSNCKVAGVSESVYTGEMPASGPTSGENTSFLFRGKAPSGDRVAYSLWIPAKKDPVEEEVIATFVEEWSLSSPGGVVGQYVGQREGRNYDTA